MKHCEILNSKLSAPTVTGTIVRERLFPHYEALLNHKVTIVAAPAGYGKSVCISQACQHLGVSKIWYRLEESDMDPVNFISYIVAGIRKEKPGYADTILDRLSTALFGNTVSRSLLTALVNELEQSFSDDMVLVFDDCHHINNSSDINEILGFFLEHLPSRFHIVIISRNDPTVSLSKFRANLKLHEITQDDLAFSSGETVRLYKQLFGYEISETNLHRLYGKTQGWVSGLLLFYHITKGKTPAQVEAFLKSIRGTHKVFKEYLGENVFAVLEPEVRKFLLKTSVLNQMTPDFCNRFLGIKTSGAILAKLEKEHLFTCSIDNNSTTYCYHHLFQEFLRAKLTDEDIEQLTEIHIKAAELYEEANHIDEALDHYLHAEAYDEVFRLLELEGIALIRQGRHRTLGRILNRIPGDYFETEPWPLALKAMIFSSMGDLNQSTKYHLRAQELFEHRGMVGAAERNLMELGRTWYLIGDLQKAETAFMKIMTNEPVPPIIKLEVLGHLIIITAASGNMAQSDVWFQEAESELEHIDTDSDTIAGLIIFIRINYAIACRFKGDILKAIEYSDSVFNDIEKSGSWLFMAQYCHISSLSHMFLGNLDQAREKIDLGLYNINTKGVQGTTDAFLLLVSAVWNLITGHIDNAENDLKKGMEVFIRGGSKWGEASMLMPYTIFYAKTGQAEKAVASATKGLQLAQEYNYPWIEGTLNSYYAISLIENGQYQEALAILNHAADILGSYNFELFQIIIYRAVCQWEAGDMDAACDTMTEALVLGMKYKYGAWNYFALPQCTPLLVNTYGTGRMRSQIKSVFRDYGFSDWDTLYQLQKKGNKNIKKAISEIRQELPKQEGPPLKIFCLGRFRIFVGDREIKNQEWKSLKSLSIFKYLVLSRSKGPVNKDVLQELIWPDEDPEITNKRLHVALPAIRKALEPDVKRGESRYLVRDMESYTIDIGEEGVVDVEQFVAEIILAEKETDNDKSIHHLIRAEVLYKGELFGDDRYAEWCIEEREHLNRLYLNVLDRIILRYEILQNYKKCIEYAEKYLKLDCYAEEIYIKLMEFYHATGNHFMVLKTWETCRKYIEQELNCPLSDEIIELHDRLVKARV